MRIIIQARMTSTRLPGKVLLPLCGDTVLGIMLRRLEAFKDAIIIATTDDGSEAPIVAWCEEHGIPCHRGSTEDVLSRYYNAAVAFGERGTIIRLTSDCPLIDPEVIRAMLDQFDSGAYDYLSNTTSRTFPRGLDTEIFTFEALKSAHEKALLPLEREHVTPYIHTTHKEQFRIGQFADTADHSRYRLTLDEPDDYAMIQALYEKLGCRTDFDYHTLVDTLEAHPKIAAMNAHVEQKKS